MRLVKNLLGLTPPKTGAATAKDQAAGVRPAEPTAAGGDAIAPDGLDTAGTSSGSAAALMGGSKPGGGTAAHTLRFLQAQAGGDVAKASLRRSLAAGRAVPGMYAAAVSEIIGQPLGLDGLQALYGECLPGAHAIVTCGEVDQHKRELGFFVSWFDNAGHELGRCGRSIRRHDDGSLELHAHTVWVDEGARGQALSVKATEQDLTMLRALSDHERSCCSLRAGYMHDVNKTGDGESMNEQIGSYAWANFGYDFADAHDKRPFFLYGERIPDEGLDDRRLSTVDLCKKQFGAFVDDAAKAGQLPDDPALLQSLKDAAATWQHPWEIASFTLPGLSITRQIGSRETQMHLGKAFLTSPFAVNWDGVFFVNAPRDAGQDIRDKYFERNVAKAKQRADETSACWINALRDGSPSEALDVLRAISQRGTPEHITLLKATRQRRPELLRGIDDALAHVSGRHLTDGPSVRINLKGQRPRDYQLQLHAWMLLGGDKTDLKVIEHCLNDEDGSRCWAGARVLVERELERDPALVARHLVKNDHGAWILDECLTDDELKIVKEHAPLLSGHVFKEVERRRAEAEAKRQEEMAELEKKIAALKAEMGDDEPEQRVVDDDPSIQAVRLPEAVRHRDADAGPEQVESVEEEDA